MEPAQFEILFRLYLNGKGDREQIKAVFDYIDNAENEQLVLEQMRQAIRNQELETLLPEKKQKEILNRIFESTPGLKHHHHVNYHWVKIAAAILVFIATVFLILDRYTPISNKKKFTAKNAVVNDVMPGGNRAVLTLGNGAEIVLDNLKQGEIGQEGDARIVKLGDGQISYSKMGTDKHTVLYNVMTTPRGGQYKLVLPDGTNVWLNAASSIKYPTSFTGNAREVSTTGEVYFEVVKDIKKPFYVRSENQLIQVLGTHFNVNAYKNEADVKTTLLEGSVKIIPVTSTENSGITIKPNEQASFSNGRFIKTVVNAEDAIAWKNGFTSFDNADVKTIMKQIERWYDVDIVYNKDFASNRLFSGDIPRTATLSEVFKILELNDIHFKIEGKVVMISS